MWLIVFAVVNLIAFSCVSELQFSNLRQYWREGKGIFQLKWDFCWTASAVDRNLVQPLSIGFTWQTERKGSVTMRGLVCGGNPADVHNIVKSQHTRVAEFTQHAKLKYIWIIRGSVSCANQPSAVNLWFSMYGTTFNSINHRAINWINVLLITANFHWVLWLDKYA